MGGTDGFGRGLEQGAGRLPHDRGARPCGGDDRGEERTRPRPQAVRGGIGRVVVGGDQPGSPLDQERRRPQFRVVRRPIPSHHHQVAPLRLTVQQLDPGLAECLPDTAFTDHERRLAWPSPPAKHRRRRQGGGQDLLRLRFDPEPQQLLRHLLGHPGGVVGEKNDADVSLAEVPDHPGSRGHGPVSPIEDAVEVEEEGVVPLGQDRPAHAQGSALRNGRINRRSGPGRPDRPPRPAAWRWPASDGRWPGSAARFGRTRGPGRSGRSR